MTVRGRHTTVKWITTVTAAVIAVESILGVSDRGEMQPNPAVLAAGYGAFLATEALGRAMYLCIARAAGARIRRLTIGFGPLVWTRIGLRTCVEVKALPLAIGYDLWFSARRGMPRQRQAFAALALLCPVVSLPLWLFAMPYQERLGALTGWLGAVIAKAVTTDSSFKCSILRLAVAGLPAPVDAAALHRFTTHRDALDAALSGNEQCARQMLLTGRGEGWSQAAVLQTELCIVAARGDHRGGIAAVERALSEAPDPSVRKVAQHWLAQFVLRAAEAGDLTMGEAIARADAADAASCTHGETHCPSHLALSAVLTGDYDRALPLARSCVEAATEPVSRADELCTLALAQLGTGDQRGAFRSLRQARSLASTYPRVDVVERRLAVLAATVSQ